MRQYLDLLRYVTGDGIKRSDRTKTGTLSVFGYQMRFDLSAGFPICTTKRVWFKGLACEMLWFLSGETNIKPLVDQKISIWTAWPLVQYLKKNKTPIPPSNSEEWKEHMYLFEKRIREEKDFYKEYGNLGPVYGKQWVDFNGTNQIEEVIESIRTNPNSRRHIVSAWNPPQIHAMELPPCHMFFQFYVAEDRLSCQIYVRSNDLFLGAPFNIAQYALLTHMIAQQTDLEVGELVYTIGDAHAYLNHLEAIKEQLTREPMPLPQLEILRRPSSIFKYRFSDFKLHNYQHHPTIRAPIAV